MSIKRIFSFFIRLFAAFLASKLFLGLLGADTPASLLGFAVLLVLGTYALEIWGAKIGWVVARLLISMNQLPSRRTPKQPPRE